MKENKGSWKMVWAVDCCTKKLWKKSMQEVREKTCRLSWPLPIFARALLLVQAMGGKFGGRGDGNFYMRCGARLRGSCSHDCAASPQGMSESRRMMGVLCLQGRVNPFLFFSFFHTLHLVCVYIYIKNRENHPN